MKRREVLLAFGSLIVMVASSHPVYAQPEGPVASYEILVVTNRAYGDLVAKGKYQRAIDRIATKPNAFPFATATNLCVAHSLLKQFEQAAPHCDQAIQLAERSASSVRADRKRRDEATDMWAQAYSNRGVLRAMRGDTGGAGADFQNALGLRENMGAPARNFALLQLETAHSIAAQKRVIDKD